MKELGLEPEPVRGEIREAGREPIFVDYYSVRLYLPNISLEFEIPCLPFLHPPHEVLIGRDVLSKCVLVVDFMKGLTGLHFKAHDHG